MTYKVFGLTIDSEIEIPGFPLHPAPESPDVEIALGDIPLGGMEHDGFRRVSAKAKDLLRASVVDGERILVHPVEGGDRLFMTAVVSGELMAVLLRQRGLQVLHGSAVARNGRGVGFIGDSGWGKSTLANSLMNRGWRLLTDDLLVIAEDGSGEPAVHRIIPGHASMRLSPEAAEHFGEERHRLPRAHGLTQKLRVQREDFFGAASVVLDRIYVLGSGGDRHQAIGLDSRDAVTELIRHTRGHRLMDGESARRQNLSQCAALARDIGVYRLVRREGLEHIGGLCDLVEAGVSDQ